MTESAGAKPSSRERILVAAATMLSEDPTARLSVRAVAAKAGVSTGSLRHHFPTQHALQDAVLTGIYDVMFPGEPIRDTDLPPRDRLVACLRQILAPAGAGEQARQTVGRAYASLIAEEPTEEQRQAYQVIEQQMRQRVEHWLSLLAGEGALPDGDHSQRAKFLLTVVNGLTFERALPRSESALVSENATLFAAADAVLNGTA
ncbi:TetR/AcrR family transcriptional regulator [Nocardiopsis sp. MG754419]|uniref:TetR/AcrR family transcriptional regulator n=1 Tax=Nocardiopsis sp. MG754419 TaxID=2259865 RepID=UPI001BA4CBC6|nr:TetR/AcrR family transcriptional regulator [Nocardiopsis sp. MG754419]MBR8741204.1 TetR/AcrR family transcriptional regulator [Nocardiopsis sp. MG754419]